MLCKCSSGLLRIFKTVEFPLLVVSLHSYQQIPSLFALVPWSQPICSSIVYFAIIYLIDIVIIASSGLSTGFELSLSGQWTNFLPLEKKTSSDRARTNNLCCCFLENVDEILCRLFHLTKQIELACVCFLLRKVVSSWQNHSDAFHLFPLQKKIILFGRKLICCEFVEPPRCLVFSCVAGWCLQCNSTSILIFIEYFPVNQTHLAEGLCLSTGVYSWRQLLYQPLKVITREGVSHSALTRLPTGSWIRHLRLLRHLGVLGQLSRLCSRKKEQWETFEYNIEAQGKVCDVDLLY